MSEESAIIQIKPEPLPCDTIVYRALLRPEWINEDTKKVSDQAYYLRKLEQGIENGISVNIAKLCSPEMCARRFNKCIGVASLHVGKIREIDLDVIVDQGDHALIIGLPFKDNALKQAKRLAHLLAKQSRIILRF
jgi:hypothetical protein